jgi:hypothetical protein
MSSWEWAELTCETLGKWKGTPAVDRWCSETLPSMIINHLYGTLHWIPNNKIALDKLLNFTKASNEDRIKIIIKGIAGVREGFGSQALFVFAERIVSNLDKNQANELQSWYSQRLRHRYSEKKQLVHISSDIPTDVNETIARFLFALMSDIDTRIRWKAAHVVRRMAQLGCHDMIKACALQLNRNNDDAFRKPDAPFYALGAKLWMLISFYRISVDNPEALQCCKSEIFEVAVSSELPHVAIREYAKRTLVQLEFSEIISLSTSEKMHLHKANTAQKGQTSKEQNMFGRWECDNRRFSFDEIDTLKYWYEDVLSVFPTASKNLMLDIAEKWIIDNLKVDIENQSLDGNSRKKRYDNYYYSLWSHYSGSLPSIESYNTYLEWHALQCVVGELLMTHPISKDNNSDYFTYSYWLKKFLPSDEPAWLSDHRSPTPIEDRLWIKDPKTDDDWLQYIRKDEFLTEIGIHTKFRKDWIVIEAAHSMFHDKRISNILISSALVSPKTASALVCALQTVNEPFFIRISNEDWDNLDSPPFRLIGWLELIDSDMRFDVNDTFRYDVNRIEVKPGKKLINKLNLVSQEDNHLTWNCKETKESAFIYEAWCDEPSEENKGSSNRIASDGWRLWAKTDLIKKYIANEGWDLIYNMHINRQLKEGYRISYEEKNTKKKRHKKILLFKPEGSIIDFKGGIGSW